jgi:hypothetical protein
MLKQGHLTSPAFLFIAPQRAQHRLSLRAITRVAAAVDEVALLMHARAMQHHALPGVCRTVCSVQQKACMRHSSSLTRT